MAAEITLTITLTQNGEISVGGPIENKILSLGLLELGKQAVLNYVPSVIQVAKTL